jgi:hypothetical protein
MALCLDPEPQVIAAIFQNPTAGRDQARMVSRHHKTPQGLEQIVRRSEFVHDPEVHRALVRNEMLNESQMRRILSIKRLAEVYRIAIDRDLPERNRVWARSNLRTKWNQSPPEDRAELVISTEARCLALLAGQTFDARLTAILASRPYGSLIFVRNLAQFPACPPPLLVHLMRQPLVRRTPFLRNLILQHPRLPSEMRLPR